MYKMRCKKCRKQTLHENGQCFGCGIITSERDFTISEIEEYGTSKSRNTRKESSRTRSNTAIVVRNILDDSNYDD